MKLGVCWYPEQWPQSIWASDVRRMVELGLTFVRIGEFAWSRLEPEPGQFDWGWMDRVLDLCASAGLNVVMGTPTATPPKWLVDAHPGILARGRNGQVRHFGSRRHYCFSSDTYLGQACRITEAVARRYGRHGAITTWQTDNEYGCHDTVVSTSDAARAGFRIWLAARFGSIEALNTAWGLSFWAQEYRHWDEIDPPYGTVTESHPAHRLDWQRYSSDMVARFNQAQVDILREHAPGCDILHNYMGLFTEFDHHKVGEPMDIAAWDSYPIGFLGQGPFSPEEKRRYLRLGHPDLAAFHHDLYRGVGRGRWWVIEQQPGPVNWAAWNPAPAAGAVRLWSLEAFAHGAERLSYFRWRQAPTGQEAMHAGLLRPDDQPAPGFAEAATVIGELGALGPPPETERAPTALIFDYDSIWGLQAQPQGRDYDGLAQAMRWYGAARQLGLDVDIVPPGADLAGYKLVLMPASLFVDDGLAARLAASGAHILAGPRTGAKTQAFAIPADLPPGALQSLIAIKVARVESLSPGIVLPAGNLGSVIGWMEDIDTSASTEVLDSLYDGRPLWIAQSRCHYLAGVPDVALLGHVIADIAARAGLATENLPAHVRTRRRGGLRFVFNYGDTDVTIDRPLRLGVSPIPPGGVAAFDDLGDQPWPH
ncbi:beta-galactosidase [Sandarakinorhabdus sp.]|uniref:beta-galactosidase n=1 Tax=Sandarakinorhabdus sp. TaxID=1916663 RepID=UPI00286EAC1F|nr:beta-galactosidase [Sandarakinorhabdus sp.]